MRNWLWLRNVGSDHWMRVLRDGGGQAAAPVGGEAWPDFEISRAEQHQPRRPHWCGGRRRDRRARAGFEARRRTK